ncbi:hypothetical protein IWT140_01715 [Secundilactobacillus pentosiphilus]|uniref:Uncharacterized protein n=1 Tax=Secundilactobacillus pentosiphilus TaxID=1714682 RepID=A0A1Z5IR29_9LACO|nr:hypothetical protein [Secundilactobacillus pentosiphilus]GAX04078.1 hypothetical protein IWT140_01715 [Secundilactobacillus pentosiphilus]
MAQMAHTYNTGREILMNFAEALTFPATVKDDSAVADSDGRKIIKAGTPLGAGTDFLSDRTNTVLSPVTDATAQVVAMHDIDVTQGQTSATVIVRGDVIKENMDDDVQKLYTPDMVKTLSRITLV